MFLWIFYVKKEKSSIIIINIYIESTLIYVCIYIDESVFGNTCVYKCMSIAYVS